MTSTAHPITLAIEISNPPDSEGDAGEVALRTKAGDVHARPLAPEGRHDDALMPAIDRLISDAGMAPADLEQIAVSIGPGGFTSTRIAVTTARMLTLATGAVIVPVPTPLVAAWNALDGRTIATILATKRQSAWVSIFQRARPPAETALSDAEIGQLMEAEDLARAASDASIDLIIAGAALPESFAHWIDASGVQRAPLNLRAGDCLAASDALPAAQQCDSVLPLYPREPEAVTKWRQRHPA